MRRSLLILLFALLAVVLVPGKVYAADADQWEAIKDSLEKASALVKTDTAGAQAHVDEAYTVFAEKLAPAGKASQSLVGTISRDFEAAAYAAKHGDSLALTLEIEKIEKAGLGLLLVSFEHSLKNGRVEEAAGWFKVLAKSLKLPDSADPVREMAAITEDHQLAKASGGKIISAVTAKLIGKVAEEIDEALVAADPKSDQRDLSEALIKTAEGIGYFRAVEAKLADKLGFEDSARVNGLLWQMNNALIDGDWPKAQKAADAAKHEVAEAETTKKLSGSAFSQEIAGIQTSLSAASKAAAAGQTAGAKKQADEAWSGFTRVESQIRQLDASTYVRIEKIFAQIKEHPNAGQTSELSGLFKKVLAIQAGEQTAAKASSSEVIFTMFERVQPIAFSLLALLGIYPLYLISKAFGWRHPAWRNIGIFIILLIVPVFMEALGRLGVEMKVPMLQALSFTVNEWAKMVWALLILAAFMFAINGLRVFCAQFGIKAFGVRHDAEETPYSSDIANVATD